jgi:parallel beta-helix repeat protein
MIMKKNNGYFLIALALALASCPGAYDAELTTGGGYVPQEFPGKGAVVPFVTFEAEDAIYYGELISGKGYRTPEGEASGKKAVKLSGKDQYVEFILPYPANAMVLRYSMPDTDGQGTSGMLAVYADGTKIKDMPVTSKHAAVYGGYPFVNNPGAGGRIRFYDDTRLLLGADYPAGTAIKIQKEDSVSWYIIDLAEFETIPAELAQPADSVSIADYGAVGNGSTDCRGALNSAINTAKSQNKAVWIPAGTFYIAGTGNINASGVTIAGAGVWHSTLTGGPYFMAGGDNNYFHDFAIFGSVTHRVDSNRHCAIEIGGGSNGRYEDLWIEHVKCGYWISGANNITIKNNRIRNTYADGINLARGSSYITVENCDMRTHGDDGIAINSENNFHNTNNMIKNNTVRLTYHASCLAVYGGGNNTFKDNTAYDTIGFGSGINVSSRFEPQGFAGTTTITGNVFCRTGSHAQNTEWNKNNGAIWLVAWDKNIGGTINFTDNRIKDSLFDGITIDGSRGITGVNFTNITIENPGGYGVLIHNGGVSGSAKFTNVQVTGGTGAMHNARGSAFTVTDGGSNSW